MTNGPDTPPQLEPTPAKPGGKRGKRARPGSGSNAKGGKAKSQRRNKAKKDTLYDTLFVHVGAPKTATTTLQSWINTNRRKLMGTGYDVFTPKQMRSSGALRHYLTYYRNDAEAPNLSAFTEFFGSPKNPSAIISEEAFTNDLIPYDGIRANGFQRTARLAKFLKSLPVNNVKVLLTVRRQDSFLKAAYSHVIRRKGVMTQFDDWIHEFVDRDALSWLTATRLLENELGAENVTVVPFEHLIQTDERMFYQACLAPLDVSVAEHDAPEEPNRNESLSHVTLEVARLINTLPCKDDALLTKRRKQLSSINELMLELGDIKAKIDITALGADLAQRYKDDNAALCAAKFPTLGRGFLFGD